jgi:hypothetical protein
MPKSVALICLKINRNIEQHNGKVQCTDFVKWKESSYDMRPLQNLVIPTEKM